jgi:CheY-like chemotaxis protein
LARKILLADDSVTAQNMGRKILADAGYDVVTVNNGSAALKRITEIKPDLIVLDVYMPGYSGLEVCQRLKDSDDTAHIPVLLTVGKLEPFKPDEARRVRADGHIVKPFEASELLTAITRLEDRIVPQHAGETGRKAEGDGETGWKSRLRFPSKKKKEEPEPEPEDIAAEASFRDYRKAKSKTGASAPFAVKAPAAREPELVPDIPRDITPEELDALSALAAKLDGAAAVENVSPFPEKSLPEKEIAPPEARVAEVATAQTEAVKSEAVKPEAIEIAAINIAAEVSAASAVHVKEEAAKEVETPAPVVEPAAAAINANAPVLAAAEAVEAKVETEVGTKSVAEIPAEPVDLSNPLAAAIETQAGISPAVVAAPVNTAGFAKPPAPVDRNDEPMFVSAPNAVEPATERSKDEIAAKPAEVAAAQDPESKSEPLQAVELNAEKSAQPIAASAPVPAEPEEPAPTDAELAEALRLLTPATGSAQVSTVPTHGTLVAAGQLLAEEAARNATAGPRWMAEPVALTSEEAAMSLEAEMFRTFAIVPATLPDTVPATFSTISSSGEIQPPRITGVSAIAAAVENRLAEAAIAAGAKALAAHEADSSSERFSSERSSSEHSSETTAPQVSIMEEPAAVATAVSNPAPAAMEPEQIAPEQAKTEPLSAEQLNAEKIEATQLEATQKDSPVSIAAEAVEAPVATFADAVANSGATMEPNAEQNTVEPNAEQNGESVGAATATATVEENQDSSSDSGGEESMGTDAKSKSGKSNWHQIRTAPANTAASGNLVEAAKQSDHGAEEAPKAMAAAAAEGSASASATDASTIASIVDSVMADLRPKIVEEIAKKLAGK